MCENDSLRVLYRLIALIHYIGQCVRGYVTGVAYAAQETMILNQGVCVLSPGGYMIFFLHALWPSVSIIHLLLLPSQTLTSALLSGAVLRSILQEPDLYSGVFLHCELSSPLKSKTLKPH